MFDEMAPDEIGEYLWENNRKDFNGKFFWVGDKRLYPIYEGDHIEGWEFD